MPKIDQTSRYISQNLHDYVEARINPNDAPPHRVSVPRLSYSSTSTPIKFSFDELAESVEKSSLSTHVFFLDTCFVKSFVPQRCWEALVSRTIGITHWINYELEEWRRNPQINHFFHKAYMDSLRSKDDRFTFLPEREADPHLESGISHYIALLCQRKKIFQRVREHLKMTLGIEPSDQAVHSEIQRLVKERGMTLANKGQKDIQKPNFSADEDLVVRALAFALTTGREVSILTRDSDLIEQFFKLQYLLDTHYRSYLLAQSYADQPLNFRKVFESNPNRSLAPFESLEIYHMPAGMETRVLPDDFTPVNINVLRISESGGNLFASELRFSCEVEMKDVFYVKGKTNGLNTDLLAGSNLHRCVDPNLQDELGRCLGITKDYFLSDETQRFTKTDLLMALQPLERSVEIRPVEIPTESIKKSVLWQAKELAYFQLPRRLAATYSFDWTQMDLEALSQAVELMSPWTRILVSEELLSDVPDRLVNALLSKDCYVLPTVSVDSPFTKIQPIPTGEGRKIIDYYTALLAYRKMFGRQRQDMLRNRFGRMPTEKELYREVVSYCDPSSWFLAKDYLDRRGDTKVFDDEHLVVDALFRAICNGRESLILTRRKTLVHQFFTLAKRIQSHYIAWAIAKCDSERLLSIDLPRQKKLFAFESELAAISYDEDFIKSSLPRNSLQIDTQVWLFEGDFQRRFSSYMVGFPVEPAMLQMMQCKENNSFRVAEWESSRNLYAYYQQDPVNLKESAKCLLGCDGEVKIGSLDFPADENLKLSIDSVPAFDITQMIQTEIESPFPWAIAERNRLKTEMQKERQRMLKKKRPRR